MCEKVGFCPLFIRFQGSDEDGAEIGGRGSCGGRLRHSNRNSDEPVGDESKQGGRLESYRVRTSQR